MSVRLVKAAKPANSTSDFRHHAACRDEDAELFFPVGVNGPAFEQTEKAKAVCHDRCPKWVRERCLSFALDAGIDYGVFGGMSEDERRAHKKRLARHHVRPAA